MKETVKMASLGVVAAGLTLVASALPAVAQVPAYNLELRTRAIDFCAAKLSAGEISPLEMNACVNSAYQDLLSRQTNPSPGSIIPPSGINCNIPSRINDCTKP